MLVAIVATTALAANWMLEQTPEPTETAGKPHLPGIITGK
jgi:hypothetical protein